MLPVGGLLTHIIILKDAHVITVHTYTQRQKLCIQKWHKGATLKQKKSFCD